MFPYAVRSTYPALVGHMSIPLAAPHVLTSSLSVDNYSIPYPTYWVGGDLAKTQTKHMYGGSVETPFFPCIPARMGV